MTESQQSMLQLLEMIREAHTHNMRSLSTETGWFYQGPADLLLREARWYAKASVMPWHHSEVKACFRNAALYAIAHPGIRYCEGYACSAVPVHHGWCLDKDDCVIELTWKTVGSDYFGVEFNPRLVMRGSVLFHEPNARIYKRQLKNTRVTAKALSRG